MTGSNVWLQMTSLAQHDTAQIWEELALVY